MSESECVLSGLRLTSRLGTGQLRAEYSIHAKSYHATVKHFYAGPGTCCCTLSASPRPRSERTCHTDRPTITYVLVLYTYRMYQISINRTCFYSTSTHKFK